MPWRLDVSRTDIKLQELDGTSPVIAKPQVLLIDEDPDDLAYNGAMLLKLGCKVTACAYYSDGLQRLEAEAWDFVVLSEGGPAFEGRSVLELAVKVSRSLPVLVVTNWHNMPSYLEAMQLGAVDYLEKPVSLWEMARMLNSHLPRRSGTAWTPQTEGLPLARAAKVGER